jgi:iron complex outermembrane recepter protein
MDYRPLPIWLILITFLAVTANPHSLHAQQMATTGQLKHLTLEELMQMEVTTASRKPQVLSSAAGAVAVLTSERIRRSGATTIADALRLAPGIHVLRSDGRTWGISARGLNSNTANKMQVLMDGRILYTPLFSGVFWDVQDAILADLDRIEVIRGAGATLWGGNAVNGVINIKSLSAQDTQGALFEAGGGNEEKAFVSARYGSKWGDSIFYRGYFRYFNRDSLALANGEDAEDDWQMGRGGFRLDSDITPTSNLTIQGDAYRGDESFLDRPDGVVSGGNLLARWQRLFKGDSDLVVIAYYDRNDRKIPNQFQEKRNTLDLDLQHRFQPFKKHDFLWGFNYRASADETEDIGTIQWRPRDRTIHHFSGFLQDDISIIPEKLVLVAGTKIEDNTLSGPEVQPNLRMAWMPHEKQIIWGAISRAVRVPARLDTDLRFFLAPGVLAFQGNPDFKPEEVIAFEVGSRVSLRPNLLLDLTAFHNSYDSLITLEPGNSPMDPAIIGNGLNATTAGLTTAINYEPFNWLRSVGSLTLLHKNVELDPDSRDLANGAGGGNDPDYYWAFHMMMDPIRNLQADVILRSSGDLPTPLVPGYVTMDLRLAWLATDEIELSITGQNLFQKRHPEFGADVPTRREIERGVYGKISWTF